MSSFVRVALADMCTGAQPLDKLEREEVRKQAEKFVEPGFKLVAKEKVCGLASIRHAFLSRRPCLLPTGGPQASGWLCS